jgi:hypothetical protein
MKAKEITLNLTRNLGNYETARMAVTYEINEGDDVIDSFKSAQLEINEAFDALFPDYNAGSYVEKSVESNYDNETTIKKQPLKIDDDKFLKIKKRIMNGTLTIEDVEKYYELGDYEREVLAEIQKLKEDENEK